MALKSWELERKAREVAFSEQVKRGGDSSRHDNCHIPELPPKNTGTCNIYIAVKKAKCNPRAQLYSGLGGLTATTLQCTNQVGHKPIKLALLVIKTGPKTLIAKVTEL